MKKVLLFSTALLSANAESDRRILSGTAWSGAKQDATANSGKAAHCQFKPMSHIFAHDFTGGAPNTDRNIMGITGEVLVYNENTEGSRYPLRIANFDNTLKLDNKVANEPTYNYYIWEEGVRPDNSANTAYDPSAMDNTGTNDWKLMNAGTDLFTWKYCAYRTGDAGDGTTNTPDDPGTVCDRNEAGVSYSCNQKTAAGYGDVDGEPGTVNNYDGTAGGPSDVYAGSHNKINCQDITQLSNFQSVVAHASEGSNYRPDNVYTHDDTHNATDPAANAQTVTQEDDTRISAATWVINERVTIGVATRCGTSGTNNAALTGNTNAGTSDGTHEDFSTKDHIFAWATLRSKASYELSTQETDDDFGIYTQNVDAEEHYDSGEELVWISGDQPQGVEELTGQNQAVFSYTGLLSATEVSLETTCSIKLKVYGDDDNNCNDVNTMYAQPNSGNNIGGSTGQNTYNDGEGTPIVDQPRSGRCYAEMVSRCEITTDNNQDGTDVFDHAGLVDTIKWDVRVDSAIIQALQVSGARRLQKDNTDAKKLMDDADSIRETNQFNKTDNACRGTGTKSGGTQAGMTYLSVYSQAGAAALAAAKVNVASDDPCVPYQSAALATSPSYPTADKYACDGDCATNDPYVVLSGFYNHNMTVQCNKMDEYVAGNGDRGKMCHLYGGAVAESEFKDAMSNSPDIELDVHILEHPSTPLLKPPEDVPILYVFGIATWNQAVFNQNYGDVNTNEETEAKNTADATAAETAHPGADDYETDQGDDHHEHRRLRTAVRDTFANGGTIIANMPRGASAISTIN